MTYLATSSLAVFEDEIRVKSARYVWKPEKEKIWK